MNRQSRSLYEAGPVLLLLFVLEAIFAKCILGEFELSNLRHIILTGGLIGIIGVLAPRPQISLPPDLRHPPGRPLAPIRFCVAVLVMFGFMSCFVQQLIVANLLFWSLWAGHFFVIWWVAPHLARGMTLEDRFQFIAVVLVICAVGCILLHPINGFGQGDRLRGMFNTATFSGRFMALACVFWCARYLTTPRNPFWSLTFFTMSFGVLLMSRTRAAMAAAAAGCFVCLVIAGFAKSRVGRERFHIAFVLSIIIAGTSLVLAPDSLRDSMSQEKILAHLRLDRDLEEVFAGRATKWGKGLSEFWLHGYFGEGFLSKFGDTSNPKIVFGIAVPQYDWTGDADPHNMFLTTCQQIGIPAAAALLALVVMIFRAGKRLDDSCKCLVWGWLASGMLFGCLQGNWLTTFGNPIDRLCMLAFVFVITAPVASNGQQTPLVGRHEALLRPRQAPRRGRLGLGPVAGESADAKPVFGIRN